MNEIKPMQTMSIKGKEYIPVHERVRYFNEKHENGSIETDIVYEGDLVRCKAKVTPDVDKPARFFIGTAEEDRTQGMVNGTNATENCETSAVGRALAMMNIGIVESLASADEVAHAIHKQDAKQPGKPVRFGTNSSIKTN